MTKSTILLISESYLISSNFLISIVTRQVMTFYSKHKIVPANYFIPNMVSSLYLIC